MIGARRRHLAAKGWPMVLRRQTGVAPVVHLPVTVQAFQHDYGPGQMLGGVLQGDARIEILPDEIEAAGWPGPPRKSDTVLDDGTVWTVQGCTTLREGAQVVGFSLWVRGGK